MPPLRQRDPLPDSGSIAGISPGDAQGCKQCNLTIARGISASGAKIYREQGTISYRECALLNVDTKKVNDKEMALDEFKSKLAAGKYFIQQGNGYCSQVILSQQDLQNVTNINGIPWNTARNPSIRKLTSGGGFSSITKLFIKPAIPFNVSFNGESIQISTMTLFHPCPIRIDNIQYDAVLTLGDVGDNSAKTVILVPISGSLMPGVSGSFFSKIASFIPGILMPNPATGQYESIDIPTGKDWDLSKIFPGTAKGKETFVDAAYYVWNSTPELELYLKNTIVNPSWLPNIEQYGWRPISNTSLRKFIMLAKPIPINTFDLQTIRMLPATPSNEAIPPPLMTSLVYTPAKTCGSTKKEKFTLDEQDACDPFAQMTPPSSVTKDTIVSLLIGVITALAVVIGIYFGMKYAGQPVATKLKDWGEKVGKVISDASRSKIPTPIVPSEKTFEVENPLLKKKEEQAKAEAKKKEAEAEAQAKKKAEQEAKAEAKKKEEDEKKDLLQKMKDTSLSEQEQRKIRKDYQKLTGVYHPTKQEQELASGTGLVKKRYIAPEEPDEEEAKKLFEAEEKKAKEQEAKKKEEQTKAEAKKKEEQEEAEAKKKAEINKKKIEEANKRLQFKSPKVPPHLRPKTIGTQNLGLREDTAKLPGQEAKIPPIPPRQNPLFARVEKLKEKKEELKEKQKTQVELAREKFEKAKTETQEDKMKKQLALLKEKQEIEKEKVSRELDEAQSKLRQSLNVYRRAQQRRDIRTGRGRYKTARN